ncbi:AAA family ATPase [Dactylosporangium sp. CA-052675]|uniref:AAA family ATPase n=1 Tax=Dactylosporangium sp. CA-052675 TaxID=3239927 RepID=UPI003D8BE75B
MALTVVIGPPASGKSTWCLEHAKPGDVVIDFDRLAVALTGAGGDPHDHAAAVTTVARAARTAAIEAAVKLAGNVDVYLIHSSPGRDRMQRYLELGARIEVVDPGRDVVRERCKRERPQRMFAVIDEWYRERASQPVPAVSSPPVFAFPATTSRDW